MDTPKTTKYEIYYIGGGTCGGKSTLARLLCKKYGFALYEQDAPMQAYIEEMAAEGNELAARILAMTEDMEKMWMRPPAAMCKEEAQLYEGMFGRSMAAAQNLAVSVPVVAEGAGFLPRLMQQAGIPQNRFLCLSPTPAFRLQKYAQRPWVHLFLEGTSNPDKAFSNWMQRDALLTQQITGEANAAGYTVLQIDGERPTEEIFILAKEFFGLS